MVLVLAATLTVRIAMATATTGTGTGTVVHNNNNANRIKSGEPWHDTAGNLIDAHGAGLVQHDGRFYWYGSRRTVNASGTQMDGGIALYSSSDLYSWDFESVVLNVFNCTSNSTVPMSAFASVSASTAGAHASRFDTDYPPPSCANGNGLDLERPKVVQCGGPGNGGKFVMWVRGTGYGNSPQLVAVLESETPTGPFAFVSNRTGNSDPFRTVAKGIKNYKPGYQYADATLFQDPKTFKTYVYWRTRMSTGVAGPTGFRAMELTADCRDVVHASDTRVTSTPNREGPAVFFHEDMYYLYVSGTMGWAATSMYVYAASTPAGNFSSSNQDGHYWHAYTKGALGSTAPGAWNGTWAVTNGCLLVGTPFGNHSRDGNGGEDGVQMEFGAARSLCATAPLCAGFAFIDYDAAPAPSTVVRVTFKEVVKLYPEAEVGMQPPPIPVPGQPGNTAPAQPGVWAYDSQSTYILPNPKYTKGSRLPPFVYMGDRWDYTGTSGTSKATYVWLPLFVHPTHPGSVKVVWRKEWRLDDDSMYPF